jgi:alkylation response protein AidB-like acyl-CoA dehydrogenase
MDFNYSDEQLMLRDSARAWLAKDFPPTVIAEALDTGIDPEAEASRFQKLHALGWFEAAAEGAVQCGLLAEQSAYALLPSAFFATAVLGLPFGIDPGRATTLASSERGAPDLDDPVKTTTDSRGRVTGIKVLVPDLSRSDYAVVTTDTGPRLVSVADAAVVPRRTTDRSRPLAELHLNSTPSVALPETNAADARAWILAGVASECIGVAQRVLELAVDHATVREQYGHPVGSYQAISHALADVYIELELARSLTLWACWAVEAGDDARQLAVAAAKGEAARTAVKACEVAIQVHGGLGFTWNSVLHRYYKRALLLAAFQGHSSSHRAAIAAALLDHGVARQ